ncbi:MAG: hypothetical protein IOC86_15335 [Aestuariivirga sp.]|nr:hypothetical protein [Aestuariivirga sp.]
MTEVLTDVRVLAKLKEAAGKPMTAEEIQKQRISYIMGTLDTESTLTRDEVERMLLKREGKQLTAA